MKKSLLVLTIVLFLLPVCAFAEDGQVLINQSTVIAAGGFPYKITQPGSYKLTGNLAVPAGVDGIDITADNVTLDLNGFTISQSQQKGINTGSSGISSMGSSTTIKNGSVTGFTVSDLPNIVSVGIYLMGNGSVVNDMHADKNLYGIYTNDGIITRCTANYNIDSGFTIFGTAISDSTAKGNGLDGMDIFGSTAIHNVIISNGSFGLEATNSVLGSNVIQGNKSGDIFYFGSSISQNNNICTSGTC